MKSTTSPTPSSERKRVMRIAVSGRYICCVAYDVPTGLMLQWPPRSGSSRAPNTDGESNLGEQNQSIEPSVVTSAAVRRLPISPWSAIAAVVLGAAPCAFSVMSGALLILAQAMGSCQGSPFGRTASASFGPQVPGAYGVTGTAPGARIGSATGPAPLTVALRDD